MDIFFVEAWPPGISHRDDCWFFIALWGEIEMGLLQVELRDEGCELRWLVVPKLRRRGLGTAMIKKIVPMLPWPIYARIDDEDVASQKIAQAVGFIPQQGQWLLR